MSAFFTIYAYEALKDSLDRIEHMDFLFGEPRFLRSLDPEKTEKKAFIIDPTGLKLTNTLQQKRVASGLQTARSFVISNQDEQASETTDFELVTWLVIKAER